MLSHADLLQLKRWNTPTIYNGWEQITRHNAGADGFNLEETRDFMPQMGPMVGYAVTVQFEPSNPEHPTSNPNAWNEYRQYVASVPGPKIVVVQDLDKPRVIGAFWGEVNSNIHRALGCVGTITDGAIRDVDNLLVPVCASSTHIAWGSLRLEPIWIQLGEVAGYAVCQSLKTGDSVADLDVSQLQCTMLADGVAIAFFNKHRVAADRQDYAERQLAACHGDWDSYELD